MKFKNMLQWLPGAISELVGIIFCIIYAVVDGGNVMTYIELLGASLLPFVFPVYNIITKKPLPIILSVVTAVFVFCACDLGSAMGVYDKIRCWDLILHGVFGFVCSLIVFIFLIRWNGLQMSPFGFLLIIFAFTMGVAALWEVLEYITDRITGNDAQRVEESIALGKSPLADTMEDIMIAMAGSAVFYVTLALDKLINYKVYNRLCGFSGFKKPDSMPRQYPDESAE